MSKSTDPSKLRLSLSGAHALDVKISQVTENSFKAQVRDSINEMRGKGKYFVKMEVVNLTKTGALDAITHLFIKAKLANQLIQMKEGKQTDPVLMTSNPAFAPRSAFEVKKPVPPPPRKALESRDDSEGSLPSLDSSVTVSEAGSFNAELRQVGEESPDSLSIEYVDESPRTPDGHFKPVTQRDMRAENIEVRRNLSELTGVDLEHASYSEVMFAIHHADITRSPENRELIDKFIETEKFNRFENRPLSPIADRPVTPPKKLTQDQIRQFKTDLLKELPRDLDFYKLEPEAKRSIFFRTLQIIKDGYRIDPNWRELNECSSIDEAFESTSLNKLQAIARRSLYPEERELIDLLIKVLKNTFDSRNA